VVTATQIGLGSVNDTADSDKPISVAQQVALDAKLDLRGENIGDLYPQRIFVSGAIDPSGFNGFFAYVGLDASQRPFYYHEVNSNFRLNSDVSGGVISGFAMRIYDDDVYFTSNGVGTFVPTRTGWSAIGNGIGVPVLEYDPCKFELMEALEITDKAPISDLASKVTSNSGTATNLTVNSCLYLGTTARFVVLEDGLALEVWSATDSSWVRQTEWVEK
jgi:hypothetical protein